MPDEFSGVWLSELRQPWIRQSKAFLLQRLLNPALKPDLHTGCLV